MKTIYFATGNKNKVLEVAEILKRDIKTFEVELDEVQSMDPEYVATKKVESAYKQLKKPVFIDDVSVFIESLDGFPGPFAKFYLDTLKHAKVLDHISKYKNRNVKVISIVAFHDGNKIHLFSGILKGVFAKKQLGTRGWGFDSIIIPDGYTKTFAELGPEVKNKISHRGLAIIKFKEFLDKQKT